MKIWRRLWIAVGVLLAACSRVPDGTFQGRLEGAVEREWSGNAEFCRVGNLAQFRLWKGRHVDGVLFFASGEGGVRSGPVKEFSRFMDGDPGIYAWVPDSVVRGRYVASGRVTITQSDSLRLAGRVKLVIARPRVDSAAAIPPPVTASATFSARRTNGCPMTPNQ